MEELNNNNSSKAIDTSFIPIASPSDMDADLVKNAYRNVSFSPEQRGRADRQAYADDVNALYNELYPACQNDEQRSYLDEQIARYKKNYLERYGAYLRSLSGVASTMITGASKFPVRQQEKRNAAANSKLEEFTEWQQAARAAIKRGIRERYTEDELAAAQWRHIERSIKSDLETIHGLDTKTGKLLYLNRAGFVTGIIGILERAANKGEVENVQRGLALIEEYNAANEKPAITKRSKVWGFVEVATRVRESKEKTLKQGAEVVQTGKVLGEGGETLTWEIKKNPEEDRLQIIFSGKPDAELRNNLKGAAFHWSPTNGAWQRQLTVAAEFAAINVMREYASF